MSEGLDLVALKGKYREMILKKIRDAKLSDDLDELYGTLALMHETYKVCFGETLDEDEEIKRTFAEKLMGLIQEALDQ